MNTTSSEGQEQTLFQDSAEKIIVSSQSKIYSQHFQTTYNKIDNIAKDIYKYLLDIKQDRRKVGNKSEELESIKDELRKALLALKNQKYQVAVIAAMKAGKSTFLNAMIGADILASESEACTVCRTDVRPIQSDRTPRLLEYREGQRIPVLVSEGDSKKIRQDFLDRTHEIRQTNNKDKITHFELWHPIAAISKYPSLAGFTLVDTPGPNEWESASFNTVELKETALQALRTCNAILFILDYTSFQDDTNQLLLKDLIETRKEFIAENTGKIYFILNKVDRRSQRDRPITEVIKDLKETLTNFGIPNPVIYPVSAWKGLLSKLIISEKASDIHKVDFIKFFLGEYIGGSLTVPNPSEIAPQALIDSGMMTVETEVIQNIIQNSAWNLLNEVLLKIARQGKAIEDTLNQAVWGWETEFESLKQTVSDFTTHANSARAKLGAVKGLVENQKQILIEGFTQGINLFAEEAKKKIQEEIEIIAYQRRAYLKAENKSAVSYQEFKEQKIQEISKSNFSINWRTIIESSGQKVLANEGNSFNFIPEVGKKLERGFKLFERAKIPLVEKLVKVIPSSLTIANLAEYDYLKCDDGQNDKEFDPYKLKVETKEEAKAIEETINQFCAPLIKAWWVDTQDKLIREGTKIRELLAAKIKRDIQEISDELSDYLGDALQVELNIHEIEFPSFEFLGIDAKINQQQEIIAVVKIRQEKRFDDGFCKKKVYTVDVPYKSEEIKSFYEVDMRQTAAEIKNIIDEQVPQTQEVLRRVIDKQISEDFTTAEKQINNYIKRSQTVLNRLLRDRQNKEIQADLVISLFKLQKARLEGYLNQLQEIQKTLNIWKPLYCSYLKK